MTWLLRLPWLVCGSDQYRLHHSSWLGNQTVPTELTKMGGIQNSQEMRQAGFSLAASPLASRAASRLLRQESTPGTRIPPATQSARSCLFSPSLWYHGVYHVKRPISIHLNSYLAARLGGMQQKILSWGSAMNNTFLLFYSPKPGGQVWTIVHTLMGFFRFC